MDDLLEKLSAEEFNYLELDWKESHEDYFKTIDKDAEYFSIIVRQNGVDEDLLDDPSLVKKTPVRFASEIEEKAWRLVGHNQEWNFARTNIENHFKNCPDVDIDKEFNNYMQCYVQSKSPEALQEIMWDWAILKWGGEGNFGEEEFQITCFEHGQEFEQIRDQAFLPRYGHEYELIRKNFLLYPLCQVDDREGIAQFYFIKKGEQLSWIKGSHAGSYTRLAHGFYGHLFAQIQKRVKPVETCIISVNSRCEPELEEMSRDLMLMHGSLTGNYEINFKKSKKMLTGIKMVSR